MSELKLKEVNAALDSFLAKADRANLTRKELVDNLPRLMEAIKMFDRLRELYDSVEDKESPRARNYFNLAQQIASKPEGWQNADAYIRRESFLADANNVQQGDRLSPEEAQQLRKLMLMKKLQNYVEFLDMESPEDYEVFKALVLEEAKNQQVTPRSRVKKEEEDDAKRAEEIEDAKDKAVSEYQQATNELIEKESKSLRERILERCADIIKLVDEHFGALSDKIDGLEIPDSEDKEDSEDKDDSEEDNNEDDVTLVADEEARQAEERDKAIVAAIERAEKTQSERNNHPKNGNIPNKEIRFWQKRKPGETTWGEDFKQVLLWGAIGLGTIAAVAGIAEYIKSRIEDVANNLKLLQEGYAQWLSDRENKEGEREARFTSEQSAEAMANKWKKQMKEKNDPYFSNITEEDINVASAWWVSDRKLPFEEFFAEMLGIKADKTKVPILKAIMFGDEVANQDSGTIAEIEGGSKFDKSEAFTATDPYVDSGGSNAKSASVATTEGNVRAFIEAMSTQARLNVATGYTSEDDVDLIQNAHPVFSEQAAFAFLGHKAMSSIHDSLRDELPINWKDMSEAEQMSWLLNSKQGQRLATKLETEMPDTTDITDAKVTARAENIAHEMFEGEIISRSTNRKFRTLREYQKDLSTSDEQWVKEMNRIGYAGRSNWSVDDEETKRRIASIKDIGQFTQEGIEAYITKEVNKFGPSNTVVQQNTSTTVIATESPNAQSQGATP